MPQQIGLNGIYSAQNGLLLEDSADTSFGRFELAVDVDHGYRVGMFVQNTYQLPGQILSPLTRSGNVNHAASDDLLRWHYHQNPNLDARGIAKVLFLVSITAILPLFLLLSPLALAMSNSTIYFITGANRGIGLGLAKSLLGRPFTTIIASVRNDEAAKSLESELSTITTAQNSSIHTIILDFSTAIPPSTITETLKSALPNLTHIDILIANAGYAAPMSPTLAITAADLRQSFEVNTIAPLLTFQALWPYLQKSSSPAGPKAIFTSSSVGSIAAQEPFPGGAYGASRAAGNWLTRSLHLQHEKEGLVAVAVHPGWVKTRAGDFVAEEWGFEGGPPETVEGSVRGILEVVDGATRESAGGKFLLYSGGEWPW
ncbi:hypothetical protein BJX70DRAFT_396697 [Aspergillus crustosus]